MITRCEFIRIWNKVFFFLKVGDGGLSADISFVGVETFSITIVEPITPRVKKKKTISRLRTRHRLMLMLDSSFFFYRLIVFIKILLYHIYHRLRLSEKSNTDTSLVLYYTVMKTLLSVIADAFIISICR